MTPILGFLHRYLGRGPSLAVLCLLYATIIVSSCMAIGRLSPDPVRYLDIR
jgi:hypothetical protein